MTDTQASSTAYDAVRAAWQKREALFNASNSDAFRLFHGFEEGIEGVVIEKFGDVAVIQFTRDIREISDQIIKALLDSHCFKLIIAKAHQSLKMKQRVFVVHEQDPSETYWAYEHDVFYKVNPLAIHNCGLYLDARPVRQWIQHNSKDRVIMNLFSFTGSLGLAAMMGQAKSVTHLDKTVALLPQLRDNYQKNGLTFDNRDFVQGDIYRHLPRAIKAGRKFDGIILDPPPKVYKSGYARNKPQGQDFAQLVEICQQLLNPGGWLIAMFHRFEKTWDEFEKEVIDASNQVLISKERFTSESDFPESDERNKLRVSIFFKEPY